MRELRACSSRATITATRFVDHYEWGSFKGDPSAWMEKYFDAFLYLANWGTHELMIRLPRKLLDLETARTNRRPPEAVEFVAGISGARPKTRAFVTERIWAYQTKSAFSDTNCIVS